MWLPIKRVLVLLVAITAGWAAPARAAIARDAVAASTGAATGLTLTISHDCEYSGNGFIVVAVRSSADDLSGVTWNGAALTLLDKSTFGVTQLWGLQAPTTGTHNVVVTNPAFHFMQAVVKCYAGTQQSTTPDAISGSSDNNGGVNHFQMATTTVANNSWVFYAVTCADTSTAPSAGTGSSLVGQTTADATYGSLSFFDSNAAVTPAGSYSMDATLGSTTTWYTTQVSLAPAGAGGGTTRSPMLGGGVF